MTYFLDGSNPSRPASLLGSPSLREWLEWMLTRGVVGALLTPHGPSSLSGLIELQNDIIPFEPQLKSFNITRRYKIQQT